MLATVHGRRPSLMERESLPEVDENSGADSSSVPPSPSSEPGMPAKLQASYDVSPERMAIVSRARSWGVIAFMGLWLTGWTVGCVFLTTQVVEEPELSKILFGAAVLGRLAGGLCNLVLHVLRSGGVDRRLAGRAFLQAGRVDFPPAGACRSKKSWACAWPIAWWTAKTNGGNGGWSF